MKSPSTRTLPALFAGLTLAAGFLPSAHAVDFPAASPTGTVQQRVGLTDIEIVYSRPGVKDRVIFGGLVAYDKVWRTGANEATRITFSTPVIFGGTEVPAGAYALYTIPGKSEWTVVLSRNLELWGSFGYDAKDDQLRVTAKPVSLAQPVETLTIDINDIRDESATLNLLWDRTKISVPIRVNFVDQLAAQIEETMAGPDERKPYHQAAAFYYDHNIDLAKAKEWIAKAVAERNDAYWSFHLQAKILAKLGDKAGATAAAKRSIELATAAGDSSYVTSNNELLATLK